jgi:hypothetical protein
MLPKNPIPGFKSIVAAIGLIVAFFLMAGSPGCQTGSTEATVQTGVQVTQDATDAAMKLWAQSWADRQANATATKNTAALAALQVELNDVQTALTAYQTAFRAAITGWVASKDAAGTNAAPTTAALAGFSAAFASASTNLITVLKLHP